MVALVVLAGIIFAECGLLLGFFLPGDSLLFTAGLLVGGERQARTIRSGWCALVLARRSRSSGNLTGYGIGRAAGPPPVRPARLSALPRRIRREDAEPSSTGTAAWPSFWRASCRSCARSSPPWRASRAWTSARFAFFSGIGAVLWAAGVTVLGYYLGRIGWIARNVEPILLVRAAVSVLPIFVEFLRKRRAPGDQLPEPAQVGD